MSLYSTYHAAAMFAARKAEVRTPSPTLDTARGRSRTEEIADANDRLRTYKRDGGPVNLDALAISGRRTTMKADTESDPSIDASMAVKVFAFRCQFPALAADARADADLERMALLLWPTYPPEQQRQYRAAAPDMATATGDKTHGETTATVGSASLAAAHATNMQRAHQDEMAATMKDDGPLLDTAYESADAWAARRSVRRTAKADTTKDEGRFTIFKSAVSPRGRFWRAYQARDRAARQVV